MNYVYQNEEVTISIGNYQSGRKAIQMYESETGFPYATATTDLPGIAIKNYNEVLVKDYSENQGMFEFLTSNNIVTFTGKTVVSGHVELYICTLNPREQWVGNKKLFDYVV